MMTTSDGSSASVVEKLDSVSFAEFWAGQQVSCRDTIIDLKGIRLITPSALVQLAAAVYALEQDGRPATLLLHDSPIVSYLERAGFIETIETLVKLSPPRQALRSHVYSGRRGANPMLIEVTKIDSGAALPKILEQVVWVIRHRLKYRKNDAFDIATAVSEVCQNTFDHNDCTSGFFAMQGYGKGAKRFLELGVSDNGDGLYQTLRRNPQHSGIASDFEAIQIATELGTSEHDDPTRGTGLHHLMEITYKHEGMVQIWSGATKIRFRMDAKKGWGFPVPPIAGVHVALILPTQKRA